MGHMGGPGLGFVSPFVTKANPDDRRRGDAATDEGAQAAIHEQASQEHALGRGSLGDVLEAGKPLSTLGQVGSALGGHSAIGNVGGAYADDGHHAGKMPTTG